MDYTQVLLANAERRVAVLERICKQQEFDLMRAREDLARLEAARAEYARWHAQSFWTKLGTFLR